MPHSVMKTLIALEHQEIILQDLETFLQTHTVRLTPSCFNKVAVAAAQRAAAAVKAIAEAAAAAALTAETSASANIEGLRRSHLGHRAIMPF